MRLEAAIEVGRAHDGVDDGGDDQQDRKDGEGGEFLSGGEVGLQVGWLVHADQLEEEVAEGSEVDALGHN